MTLKQSENTFKSYNWDFKMKWERPWLTSNHQSTINFHLLEKYTTGGASKVTHITLSII